MNAVPPSAPAAEIGGAFRRAFERFDAARETLVLGHNDADGLASTAIFLRAFEAIGRPARSRILGRGETPWSPEIAAEIASDPPGGLVVADLGTRAGVIAPGIPTIVLDHHVPTGRPDEAVLISGHDREPIPTTSLLAAWCADAVAPAEPARLWLAALGIVGDMAEGSGFVELDEARARFGITAIRKAVSLVNAPRRASSGDASPALALLLKAATPKEVVSGLHPETARLLAAREEVQAALAAAKRVAPSVRSGVALLRFDTPCQVHPLLAQTWRGRLKDAIVLAANAGFRPGWVHFAARTAREVDLVAFLRERAPAGADGQYGGGHAGASGGALRAADWNGFVSSLGFGPDALVPEPGAPA